MQMVSTGFQGVCTGSVGESKVCDETVAMVGLTLPELIFFDDEGIVGYMLLISLTVLVSKCTHMDSGRR